MTACSHILLRWHRCVLQTCQLPLRYNGRDVASCMSWQGRSGCWAQAGKWIPCGPDAGATGPAANITGVDQDVQMLFAVRPTDAWCRMGQPPRRSLWHDCKTAILVLPVL